MKRSTLLSLAVVLPMLANAQALTEKKGLRLVEHHSSMVNNGAPFGNGANGSKSAYDFVKHTYMSSFDPATSGAYKKGEEANIDMVEHNSYYGNRGGFGITSATSSIWAGEIKGNAKSTWTSAPASFNYDTVKSAYTIALSHPILGANTVTALQAGKVYLSRIRNTTTYVAMKVTAVKNLPATYKGGDTASVYFDFDYKYGTVPTGGGTGGGTGGTGIDEVAAGDAHFTIVPNPSRSSIKLSDIPDAVAMDKATIRITDLAGRTVIMQPATTNAIQHGLQAGVYFVTLTDGNINTQEKFIVVE